MDGMGAFTAILFLAVLVEWVTERFAGKWLTGYWMVVIATALGVGVCFAYQLDLISQLVDVPKTPWGTVLTGVIVGAGSDVVHSFIKKVTPRSQ